MAVFYVLISGERSHVTDEHTLLERAQTYDERALGELYDRYAPQIYAYLFRRLGDAAAAEDLTGEVFVRVLQALRSERFWHTSFAGWLYRIAHNLVVDHYRRQARVAEVALDESLMATEGDPDSALTESLSRRRLRAALGRLTPDQQHLLALRFGEQRSAREVAEIMGKSVGAIEVWQHRTLVTLRNLLKDGEDETDVA